MECYPTQLALVAKYEELREDSWPTELRPTQVLCGMLIWLRLLFKYPLIEIFSSSALIVSIFLDVHITVLHYIFLRMASLSEVTK